MAVYVAALLPFFIAPLVFGSFIFVQGLGRRWQLAWFWLLTALLVPALVAGLVALVVLSLTPLL